MRFVFALFLFAASALPAVEADPRHVTVGAYIGDIQNLDLKTHSYSVDLYLWFRWRDESIDPATSFGFINPFELWGHTKTLEFEKPQKLPSGELYQVVRNQGRFSQKLALYDYPFDEQKIVIELEDEKLEALALNYEIAEEGVTMNPELELPGFRIGKPSLTISPRLYPTNFGDPRSARHNKFSRVRIEVPIHRPLLPYSVKLLVPIGCVILCAALMFFFEPSYVDSRVGIGITALLTIVALQITLNEDLPEVDYLVLMDKIYLASYLFVIAALALVVRSTRLMHKRDLVGAEQLDRKSLVILCAAYLVVTAAIVIPCVIR